jgi:hypothetical protein
MTTLVGTNAIRDTTIAGYHIPKGTFVGLDIQKMHVDERDWAEPEKFKPQRFLDENGKLVGWNKLHGFIPFGIGRRECPGQSLARIMLFSFSLILLHHYKFELPEGAEIPTTKLSTPRILTRPDDFRAFFNYITTGAFTPVGPLFAPVVKQDSQMNWAILIISKKSKISHILSHSRHSILQKLEQSRVVLKGGVGEGVGTPR